MYTLGEKVWKQGEEVTITTAPYQKHGAWWQDGEQENGKVVTFSTPAQENRNVAEQQTQWKTQQAAFSRLAKR